MNSKTKLEKLTTKGKVNEQMRIDFIFLGEKAIKNVTEALQRYQKDSRSEMNGLPNIHERYSFRKLLLKYLLFGA